MERREGDFWISVFGYWTIVLHKNTMLVGTNVSIMSYSFETYILTSISCLDLYNKRSRVHCSTRLFYCFFCFVISCFEGPWSFVPLPLKSGEHYFFIQNFGYFSYHPRDRNKQYHTSFYSKILQP